MKTGGRPATGTAMALSLVGSASKTRANGADAALSSWRHRSGPTRLPDDGRNQGLESSLANTSYTKRKGLR